MKKQEQEAVNKKVLDFIADFNRRCESTRKVYKLRTCSATVIETQNFYVLRSYSTIVAVIDKNTDILYDFLRYVYGFTRTSAQHISKFSHDYSCGKWGCDTVFTYRNV